MIAAFFDLDGTLCTEHVWHAFSRYFTEHRRRRLLANAFLVTHLSLWPLHRLGLLSREWFFRSWVNDMAWLLVGLRPEEGREIFHWVTDQALIPSLRPDVAEVLRQHQAESHQVVLVSGAFEELLACIGERLGVQHVVGTRLELNRGRYSGRAIEPSCFGDDKVALLTELLANSDLDVDLSQSFAYGDSIFDIAMLELVGNPVAVYPDGELWDYASQRGWQVIGEP
ncbi:MAG: HAD family hydrolase, partial [Chloroflexi bacterium]|nr:HAD family hydrolase [Chloroflexota bacterium]